MQTLFRPFEGAAAQNPLLAYIWSGYSGAHMFAFGCWRNFSQSLLLRQFHYFHETALQAAHKKNEKNRERSQTQ